MKTRGQVAVAIIGGVASVLGAIIAGMYAASATADSKYETIQTKVSNVELSTAERLTALETNQKTTQADLTEIKADVKAILRELK